jgi:hypothetical protein
MDRRVRMLYKELLYIGKEYPLGFSFFKTKLKASFMKNQHLKSAQQIDRAISHGKFVYKELEALWFLKKYRSMKNNYKL